MQDGGRSVCVKVLITKSGRLPLNLRERLGRVLTSRRSVSESLFLMRNKLRGFTSEATAGVYAHLDLMSKCVLLTFVLRTLVKIEEI